jgi:oxygen-independent coproporphyrinogen III oxidase
MKVPLVERIRQGGYDGYSYAYPHKTAYRLLNPPVPLQNAWRCEDKRNLFLYVHLPFCEMRCGFCNLFTTTRPGAGLVSDTLRAIMRQSEIVSDAISPERIAQAAFGGGTPSFLSLKQLEELFAALHKVWPVDWKSIPVSFEVSPGTVTQEKLAFLKSVGVDRISIGVQSFVREDLVSLKRPQHAYQLERALHLIRSTRFSVLNIDLIYGNEGQDGDRWERNLRSVLRWNPEELYLYPLYIRRLTNLDRSGKQPAEHRRELYLQARDSLCASGYRQVSMRLFRRTDVKRTSDYCCQDDGMIGLGPGARSYTQALHYSTEYAVGQPGVLSIINRFNARSTTEHSVADYGARLDRDEQKLRYVIKSLLRSDGISYVAYQNRFGSSVLGDVPALNELAELGLAEDFNEAFRLTEQGLSWSDTIGPWLYSDAVTNRMDTYELA